MRGSSGPAAFLSIRWKFFFIVAGVVVLMGALSIVVMSSMNAALQAEHDAKGTSLAHGVAAMAEEPVLVESSVSLAALLSDAKASDPDVIYAFVCDKRGEVIAHSFPGPFPPALLAFHRARGGTPGKSVVFETEQGPVADFGAPMMGGTIGMVHLGLSERHIGERIAGNRRDLLVVMLVFLMIGFLASYAFGTYVTQPLGELVLAAEEIGRGNLDRRSTVAGRGEIGVLSGAFNRMADDLRTYLDARRQAEESLRKAHDDLEERVKERTEQLAAANRELEAFSYSVSHDLRAPLRAIDGFSIALAEDCSGRLDETGKDYLRRIRSGCARMGALIDDLLKLSRLTRGELRRETVDLTGVAASLANELRESAPGRNVKFVIAPGIRVDGDPTLLRAAMENLIGNAWKFTRTRESARIEFGRVLRDGRPVFFVKDDGVGFDMQYAAKLFGAFQRLHSAAEFEGSGIGLATVKRIVHRHGGLVWAEGEPGKGATFYFTLGEEPA